MGEALVETAGLTKNYVTGDNIVRAVSGISLRIDAGEFVAITGRSGSGKSTLLSLLGLLEHPDAGQYRLRGQDVSRLRNDVRAEMRGRDIGFVFQLPSLLPRNSAQENVELPLTYAGIAAAERQRLASEALERVGLAHRRSHWPHQLSGGEQQRVAIARALVRRPVLILADEPTGSLDSQTAEIVLDLLTDLNREGRTIIVVTHAEEVANRACRGVLIHDGRIADSAETM
jgi:putative ABC transport system ATP-binding protein